MSLLSGADGSVPLRLEVAETLLGLDAPVLVRFSRSSTESAGRCFVLSGGGAAGECDDDTGLSTSSGQSTRRPAAAAGELVSVCLSVSFFLSPTCVSPGS